MVHTSIEIDNGSRGARARGAFKCYETQSPLGLPLTTPCSGRRAAPRAGHRREVWGVQGTWWGGRVGRFASLHVRCFKT